MLDELYVIEEGGLVLFDKCFDDLAQPVKCAQLLARFIREAFLSQKPQQHARVALEQKVFFFLREAERRLIFVLVCSAGYQSPAFELFLRQFAERYIVDFVVPNEKLGLDLPHLLGEQANVSAALNSQLQSFPFEAQAKAAPAEQKKRARPVDEKKKAEAKPKNKLDFSAATSDEAARAQEYFQASKEDKDDSFLQLDDSGEEVEAAQSSRFYLFGKLRDSLTAIREGKSLADSLKPALETFRLSLVSKNVGEEIARKICQSLEEKLVLQKASLFASTTKIVRESLREVMTEILTPKTHIDLLALGMKRREEGQPLVVVFVGVNGVGKSTNLAKVAYHFKSNNFSVMLAACDNFRAGAVEQIKVHGKYLQIPVFDRAYKDDAATIARDAIAEARAKNIEVVLVDTAGRMQDNEPLMKALARLVNINSPDVILFIGEAVAGSDIIDQLVKFNASLKHFTALSEAGRGEGREIDGILLSKYDIVDDKVGAALSLTYATGKPIVFIGTGQKYPDLKKINVESVVHNILK